MTNPSNETRQRKCGHCGLFAEMPVVYAVNQVEEHHDPRSTGPFVTTWEEGPAYYLLVCPGCSGVILEKVYYHEGFDPEDWTLTRLYPVGADANTAIFVEPSQALTRIRDLESILADLKGVVRVCDPHVDGRTLDFLAECKSASEIRLLTATIGKPNPFKRDLQAYRRQHTTIPIEVRELGGGVLHDRYAIHDDGMVLFGTSLNGFGNKQTFIMAAGSDLRKSVLPEFDRLWLAATPV